jgi:hypothetical protein
LAPPAVGSIVRITGHHDDAAAASCSMALFYGDYVEMDSDPVPSSVAHLWCRHMLVLDRYDVLGMDPDFDPSEPY